MFKKLKRVMPRKQHNPFLWFINTGNSLRSAPWATPQPPITGIYFKNHFIKI
jgi:hypothetical protein